MKYVRELEEKLSSGDIDFTLESSGTLSADLERYRGDLSRVKASISRKKLALGADGRKDLVKLASSKFLQLRLKALALKCRLRDRLRARKYEKERLERSYRNVMNGASPNPALRIPC